ncbi:hypothetical protein MJO29_005303, partial [Puccinia striiformis f. sp. tritici]
VPNEFSLDQSNYNREFFESQWQDQQSFQQNHTTTTLETLSPIPTGLRNSPHHLRRQINQLANPGTYNSIMESLIEIYEAREQQISVKVDFTLYAHAVALHAERQPLYRGTHIGTAIANRQKPITASINNFNKNWPLTYNSFTNLSLENLFWQDVYLFHLQAPWAKHADVRAGIQTVLVIDRTNGEKAIISKEFKCAMSWAVELHTSIRAKLED